MVELAPAGSRRRRRVGIDARRYWCSSDFHADRGAVRRPPRRHGAVGARRARRTDRARARAGRRPRRSATTCCAPSTPTAPAFAGVITESLAYSTLQSGPEFARWLAERGPATVARHPRSRAGRARRRHACTSRFNRPQRHNAFSTDARAALLEALEVARLDPSVTEVVLTGNGPSFCSGGDLAEFGTFADPASAHLARTRHSPALVLDEITARLGPACRAEVHGQVLGSGLEMAAFCGTVTCRARRGARPAGAGARPDPRRGRHRQHHPADRPLAHGVSGAVGPDHRPGDGAATGASSTPSPSDFGAQIALSDVSAPKSQTSSSGAASPGRCTARAGSG